MPAANAPAFSSENTRPAVWVTGLASQYPPYSLDARQLKKFAARFYDVESVGIRKLIEVSSATGITRSSVSTYDSGFGCDAEPPTIEDIDTFFRQTGVDLAVRAALKALRESACRPALITATVAVTSTSNGCPGYDVLVNRRLGLARTVDSTLLQGVGCAGGLSVLRAAARVAQAATAFGRPARVLVYAAEIYTAMLRFDLAEAERCVDAADLVPASAVLSDGAAALVVCNELGLEGLSGAAKGIYRILNCSNTIIPDTVDDVGSVVNGHGYRTILARGVVADKIRETIKAMFTDVVASSTDAEVAKSKATDFDWAFHPGSSVLINALKEALGLRDDHLRATNEIYKTRGNSSSVSVLAVLDRLRSKGTGTKHVVAAAYGPGISVEMAALGRNLGEAV